MAVASVSPVRIVVRRVEMAEHAIAGRAVAVVAAIVVRRLAADVLAVVPQTPAVNTIAMTAADSHARAETIAVPIQRHAEPRR